MKKKPDTTPPAPVAMLPLSRFIENPDNPQTVTDEAFDRLVGKLRRVPDGLTAHRIAYVTDFIAGKFVVLSGNKRLRALKLIYGEDYAAPASWFEDITSMTPAQRKEFILDANINEGEWDVEKLLEQYDTDALGDIFDADDLSNLLANVSQDQEESAKGKTDEEETPEPPKEPKSRKGEIYQLGNHRVMCGDATNADDVARLMGGGLADMIFTDPPYNVSVGSKNKMLNEIQPYNRVTEDIIGDSGMTDEEAGEKLWKPAFANMNANAADHCVIYVTMPQGGTHMMMMMMMRGSWQVKHELMWLKDSPTFSMGRLDYDYKHEPICYGWKKSHRYFGKGEHTKSVWEIPKPRKSKDHPTMKPVALVENAILNSSQEGEIVMDLFGGSGTTAIACEQTKRTARLMELDEKYVDVIRRRWAEYVHGEGCDWQALTPKVD